MSVREMTSTECHKALARTQIGRLGCVNGHQPYVVPISFAYGEEYLYGFTPLDWRVELMRANPLVCVEIDEATSNDRWMSVTACGRYEELPDTAEWAAERMRAHEYLAKRAMWWQPPFAVAQGSGSSEYMPVFYRIRIENVTGHCAAPESGDAVTAQAPSSSGRKRTGGAGHRVGTAVRLLVTSLQLRSRV